MNTVNSLLSLAEKHITSKNIPLFFKKYIEELEKPVTSNLINELTTLGLFTGTLAYSWEKLNTNEASVSNVVVHGIYGGAIGSICGRYLLHTVPITLPAYAMYNFLQPKVNIGKS